ncbi:helix-turn-helix transcriptional regulator [Phytomonospora endophytica]|uniref:DNA-binding CsgD family transcriptional regulator n=1 Tax=Phytomonospora endophytica TaxID=714109 RepID=A0A841FCZ7_9ACTN|nr:helix-turn-helix transcriptional regulator [Phytomonospora endophytica]MBB6034146.1 DNA-binding CsgD family transcriptional regulator [Phytomonospora endophytica]GIG66538.1 hypothetical protein Pen01_28330 [Phytomonospora endophytica]
MVDTALAAQQVYARMREDGTTFAASTVDLPPEQVPGVRGHLASLGLLDAAAEISVDAMAALGRLLADNREDRPLIEQILNELAELARESILELHPASDWNHHEREPARVRTRDDVALANGVRIRTLHAQITHNLPHMRRHLEARTATGVEVRYAPLVPTRMVVYDRATAIVEGDRSDPRAWAVILRGRNLAQPLAHLHDYCWTTASEAADVPGSVHDARLTEQQRTVLRMLGTGAKDDAIARALGVSTRTVTRIVGELTALLGAGSRFQAGVRAARLGWLD